MNNYLNEAQYINDELRGQITEWLHQWVICNNPVAYDKQNLMILNAIRRGMDYILEESIFGSVREIKLDFGKKYKTILPDFIFENVEDKIK